MSEIYTIIGISDYKFERDGRTFSGVSLYCIFESDRVIGYACEKVSISDIILSNLSKRPSEGDKVKFFYNRFGRVSGLEYVD